VEIPESGNFSGNVRHDFVSLSYTAERRMDRLDLKGVAGLGRRTKKLEYFILYTQAVDSEGNPLERFSLLTLGATGGMRSRFHFQESIELPPGTAALSFGYWGQTRGGGDEPGKALMGRFPAK
jgi:hypothetical protein